MAINFCDLCNSACTGANASIGNNNYQETWRTLVAQVLCGLQSTFVAPPVPLPEVAIGFAALEADYGAFASPGFLNGQDQLKRLRVNNTSDAAIEISIDGGTNVFMTVPAGEDTGFLSLGNIVVSDPDDFQIRRVSGDSATSGTLYLQGSY